MADESNDQTDTSLPQPIIDKSTFPGGGVPASVDPLPDVAVSSQKSMAQKDDAVIDDDSSQSQPMSADNSFDTPEIADDNDLIEKEWVNKAKNIIEKTKTNPHEQSDAMTLFKADYIKKRYNKTIKTSE